MLAGMLERIADRLSHPNAWVQGMMGWNGRMAVSPHHPSAIAWDLMGAVTLECGGDPEEIAAVLDVFKRTGWGHELNMIMFNDYPDRKQDDVVRFLKERAALVRMEDNEKCRS